MNSGLHQSGTFFLYALLSFLSSAWVFFKLKETSGGLTDRQKKELYVPDDMKVKVIE